MRKIAVSTPEAPKAIGPYSQAIRCGDFLFLSGQLALDAKTGELVGGGIDRQTEKILSNISAVLRDQGLGPEHVVKTTVFLKNMSDFGRMNEIYGNFFVEPFPARSTVEVARLPKDALVEIEVVALTMRTESERAF